MSKTIEIASRSFIEIAYAENASRVLHLLRHKLMGEGCAYDAAHELMFDWYDYYGNKEPLTSIRKYMNKTKRRAGVFRQHRSLLCKYLEAGDIVRLETYVYTLSFQGYSKKKIYDIFNDFFVFVEYHYEYSTEQADLIADHILDRLSGWSNNRLLPQEPNIV